MSRSAKVLVVGLGSPHGDDQAGWFAADELASRFDLSDGLVVRRATIPLDVLDWLDDVDILHICDACESTGSPEKLHRLVWSNGRLSTSSIAAHSQTVLRGAGIDRPGSHDFGLIEMLHLAETTQRLPQQVTVWAVEGCCFDPGGVMNPETRVTAMNAAGEILQELTRLAHAHA
jgi:hydrogenase maturation protease